jgi:ribosomal protein S6 kinase alpha-5
LFEPIANRQFRFSEFEAAVILRKILLAVKHMHDMDIVHRDLKPENILFSEPGIDSEVKVRAPVSLAVCRTESPWITVGRWVRR